jgi:hypothetical protein
MMNKLYRAHRLSDIASEQGEFENPYIILDRKPRESSMDLHLFADAWFTENFGIGFRSKAIFCTGSFHEMQEYCDPYHRAISINPVGSYTFCYSPNCPDMYRHFKRVGKFPWLKSHVWRELDNLGYQLVKDGSWDVAAESACEIMMIADSFRYKREFT